MNFSLFLYPLHSKDIDKKVIANSLTELHIISHQQDLNDRYTAQLSLMEHINYLGCSPTLTSGDWSAQVVLHCFDEERWMGGQPNFSLRYPGCKHLVKDAHSLFESESQQWTCPECHLQGTMDQINWRKSAARARCFIEISPIFPKEAIPNQSLLQNLNQITGSEWSWFYSAASPRP